MKPTFTTTLVGAAAIVALAVTGCKKEEEKAPGAAGGGGGGSPQAAVPAQTGFAVFPSTAKAIGGVNLASARASSLWATYKDQIEGAMSKELAEFKTTCGFDPFGTLQTLVAGFDPKTEEVVVVAKGLQRGQIKACGEKMASQKGKKFTVTDEGNLSHYETDDGTFWGAWLDDTTIVMSPDKDKNYVAQRAAGQGGVTDNAELMGLLKNVDTSATFYLVATADAWNEEQGAGSEMVKTQLKGAKGLFVSIKLAEGLKLDAGVRFDTAENAKNFTATAQGQLGMVKGQQMPPEMAGLGKAIEKTVIKQNGNDTIVQLQLTDEDIKQLAAFVQQMSQAFKGMGGAAGGDMGGGAQPAQ
jgi:hypothetical protein